MSSKTRLVSLAVSVLLSLGGAAAAKKAGGGKTAVASAQTVRAIGELAGKFQWGMTPDDIKKMVSEEIQTRYEARIKKEVSPYRQDAVRAEMNEEIDKFNKSYVKFDGQSTGWDVSIVDREFAHNNNESMLVIWEKDQRRFLFFYEGKLWKQFVAFNAENPAFAGKTFDDFANTIQKRYGPAAMTFRKLRTSDEQTLDHLEWPPAGDFVLWAVDLTSFYGNYCLSLMQRSKLAEIDRGRQLNSPRRASGNALVDSVMKETGSKADVNANIIDEITGRPTTASESRSGAKQTVAKGRKGRAEKEREKEQARAKEKENEEPSSVDPLEGTNF